MNKIMKAEELYDIPDFTGYKASKEGKIYSVIPKGCRNRFDRSKWKEPKELKPRFTKNGYARVYMRRDSTNQREDIYIHRIIAQLFIPNPYKLSDVNHLDNNPGNNNINNLEWLSHKDNLEYGLLYGNRDINELGQFCSKKK